MVTQSIEPSIEMAGQDIPGTGVSLRTLFSGPAEPGTRERELRVQMISQAGVPRWILPERVRHAVTVLRSWKPYRLSSRLKWSAITAASSANLLHVVPGVRHKTITVSTSYWERNLPGYSDSWQMVAYIGNPFPTRKALLFFVDDYDKVHAVAKAPIYPAAKPAIVNEAKTLNSLRGRLPLPEVLFCDDREGIAAQSWLEGDNVPRDFGRDHLELLSRLVSPAGRVCLRDSREFLERKIALLGPELDPLFLRRALSLLEIPDEVPACVEHGDFTPWNLRRTRDGQLTLIDWEWATECGYPWQDVCRYFYLQDYLFKESANVWAIMTTNPMLSEYRSRLGLSTAAVRGLTARFLLKHLCDEYQDGNRDRVAYAMEKIREIFA